MLTKIPKEKMFLSKQGWLESRFHFSFAEYRDYNNLNFGVLRVLNDDIIKPQSGFDMHPHKDMEIVTYIIDGELTHKDSMGHGETLQRGEVQYMSAGTGVFHSEHNWGNQDLRLLQIWILPPYKDMEPSYGSYRYKEEERKNRLCNIVSSLKGDSKIKLHQDVNFYVSELDEDREILFPLEKERQVYFVQIEGSATVNGIHVDYGDALKIADENELRIKSLTDTHFLFIEMKKEV